MRAGLLWLVLLSPLAPVALAGEPSDAPAPPAAVQPEPIAPEAREILRTCRDPIFIDCFKDWRPDGPRPRRAGEPPPPAQGAPPSPPPPDKKTVDKKPAPPKPPEKPAQDKPDPDLPTYQALLRAIQEVGLQGALHLDGPPKDGAVTLEAKIAPPRVPAVRPWIPPAITAPITEDER